MKLSLLALALVACGGAAEPTPDAAIEATADRAASVCDDDASCLYDPVTGGFEGWYDCNGLLHEPDAGFPSCGSWSPR